MGERMTKKLGSSMSMLAAIALGACAGTRPETPQTAWDTTRPTQVRVPVAPIVTTTPPTQDFSASSSGGLATLQNVPDPIPQHEVQHTFSPKATRVDHSGSVPAESRAASTQPDQADTGTDALAATTLTDSQIADALTTMQAADIAETEIVAARTENARVKAFAERVQADTQIQKQRTEALAKSSPDIASTGVRDTPIAADLRVKATKQLTLAQLAAPSELDQAFLRSQIEQTEERVELIDARLLPDATDAKLQAELKQSRSSYTRQRGEAEQVIEAIEGP